MDGWTMTGQRVTLTPQQAHAVREIERGTPVPVVLATLPSGDGSKTTVLATVNRRERQ